MGFEYMYNIKERSWDEDHLKTSSSVLSPKNHTVRLWYLFIALTSLSAFSVQVFQVFFNANLYALSTVRYGHDLIYFLYIISCFYIGYEENGVVITDIKQVRSRYLHTWFIVDLCSLIPLELLVISLPALFFLNLNRCLRVLTLFKIIASFAKEPDTNKIHVTALNSFCIMIICIQSCACIWYYNVCTSTHGSVERSCPSTFNWLQLLPDVSTNLTGISDMTLYADALYWAAITLSAVGYGDIYATNSSEVKIACFVMVIGYLAFGVIMTGMSSIISNLDAQRGRFYNRMDAIRIHMRHMGLPQELQTWVHKYYYYLWLHRKGNAIAGLWDDLPYTLRSEIATACYKPMLKKGSIFDDGDDGFIRALHDKFSTSTYSPGQVLAKPGEVNQNAYYIDNGLVQVIGDDEEKIATLLPGSFIGEVYLIFKIPRNTTISASTLCEICVLEHKDLVSLLADYPEAGLKIARAARRRLYNVKNPLSEAFALGLASNPRNVIFHQNSSTDLKPKDQRILNLFMEFMSHQLKHVPSLSNSSTDKLLGIPTFRPDERFAKIWDIVIFWCVTVSIFTETWVFFFAHNQETEGFYYTQWGLLYLLLSVSIDVVAVADIFINLRTEVMTKDGYLSDVTAIYNSYRKSWNLYFDVLAIFPFDLLSFIYNGEIHWKYLTYFRLNRLLWIRKVYLYFKKKEKDLDNNLSVQRTTKCIFLLIFSLHVCSGCLYLAGCTNHRCDKKSWAWNVGLKKTQSNFYHYMVTVYWTATTMTNIGYGDILPSNMTERLVAAAVGLTGLFIFNYIVSQIYATMSSKNAARVRFQNLLTSVTLFMDHQNLSISLQKRVRDYMSLLWSKYQGEAYPGGPFLMHDLPTELQQIVLMKERGKLLSKVPFFEQAGPAFIRDVATIAVMYFFPRGEIIQYSDTITRELFCIYRGTCQILTDTLSDIVALYGEGMYFGEVGFIFGKQAVMTVRAKTHCEILSIDFDKMKPVLERYPTMKRLIEMLQNKTDYYDHIVDKVEGLMKSKTRTLEEDVTHWKRDTTLAYEGRRYCKKSKCYVEDFGNFPIYAGAEEETIEERLLKLSKTRMIPRKPRTYVEHMKEFFFRSCPTFILMRNAILPSNTAYVRWEFFRICVAIAISIFSSLLFSFLHKERWMWILLYSLGGFCWIDIYIRMHVAFYRDNNLQVDTLETAKHYLKTSFFLDFISCFPWEIIGLIYFNVNTIALWETKPEILHFFAYFRVPHILQLYRVPLAFSFYQSEIATEKRVVTFFQFFLYTILFLHFCTCIVFAIVCPPADLNGDPALYLLPVEKHNCSRLSWVNHLDYSFNVDYETVNFMQLYAISLYFATTTLCGVGYGDIHPYLTSMRIVMIFIMVAGALYAGLLSGTVAAILANADATRATFTDKKESIKIFLKSQKVMGCLYESILNFYAFKWIRTKGVNQDILFEYLPSSLLGDVSTIIYADVIRQAFGLKIKKKQRRDLVVQNLSPLERKFSGKLEQPFFQEVLKKESLEELETDAGFIRLLSRQIRPFLFRAGDIICKRNEYGTEMYFIDKGEVDVLSIDESSVIVTLKAGQHFGEGSLLFSEPRATTIRAASNCDLFILTKASLDEAVMYYPNICREIKKAAERKQAELIQKSISSKNKKMDSLEDITRDTGYIKFYKDLMAEDYKVKHCQPTFREKHMSFISSTFWTSLLKIHNTTVDPANSIRIIYQYTSCVLLVILFWSLTYMPTTYNFSVEVYIFVMVIEYIQLFEIALKFHVAYYDKDGTYISDYKSVSRNYLFGKLGYFFDILASFPYGVTVLHLLGRVRSDQFFEAIITARLGHVPRILSALLFMREEEKCISTNLLVIRIIKYLVQGILFVHITAILFVMFVVNSDIMPSFLGDLGHDMYYYTTKYLYGAYWTLATYTTTGYGDIRPRRFDEMLFAILVMIVAKMHVIYNMGILSSSQTNRQSLQVAFEEKLQVIEAYMIDSNIPSTLHNRVTHFYNYIWTRTKGIQSEILFQDTPHCMKADIFSRICIHLLKKQQLFAHLSDTFLHHLSSKMQLISYTAGEYVKRRGDVGVGMWLIIFGHIKVNRHETKGDYYKSVSTGSILGLHLLFKRKLCGFTATAENYVDVFYLTKDCFDEVCSYYPKVAKRLYKRAYNYASVPL